MSVDIQEKIMSLLKKLKDDVPEIQTIALVSPEGSPIAIYPEEDNPERDVKIAAITASMLILGQHAVSKLKRGRMKEVVIRGKDGYVITLSAGDTAVLTVSVPKDLKLGLLYYYIIPVANELGELLKSVQSQFKII
ncbi:MAG: roadblock/LC7 domain-containing protein [Candidatus Asgardarchaeum sp.]|nr:roadblock/LC7 domain-containing protein [Candidatus Odinarchaeota archaeon]